MSALTTNRITGLRLHGRLADEFGASFEIVADCTARALHIMEANFMGRFLNAIREGEYFCWIEHKDGRKTVKFPMHDEADMISTLPSGTLHIMPRVKGASRQKGGIMAILGGVLFGAAILMSGGLAAGGIFATYNAIQGTFWGTVAQLGLGMALGGIGMMLSPQPQMEAEDTTQSYLFSGGANVISEGGAVPVIYGKPFVSSVVISAGLSVENVEIEDTDDDGFVSPLTPAVPTGLSVTSRTTYGSGLVLDAVWGAATRANGYEIGITRASAAEIVYATDDPKYTHRATAGALYSVRVRSVGFLSSVKSDWSAPFTITV